VLAPEDRTLVLGAIRFWDGKKWFVQVAVVMPDHVHAIVQPLRLESTPDAVPDLADLLKSVKGYSAYVVNRRQNTHGVLWQDERYDRIIRDEQELAETWSYLRNNPVAAELTVNPELYPWLYEAIGEREGL
jgi:REP element-mobilizing transposase RayT